MVESEIICDVCGNSFKTNFTRKRYPIRYCSIYCRAIVQRERMIKYQRTRRAKIYNFILSIHNEAHNDQMEGSAGQLNFSDSNKDRIDSTHDTWDFIPGLNYQNIGTVTGTDLSIVKDKYGQERIKGALQIKKDKDE